MIVPASWSVDGLSSDQSILVFNIKANMNSDISLQTAAIFLTNFYLKQGIG